MKQHNVANINDYLHLKDTDWIISTPSLYITVLHRNYINNIIKYSKGADQDTQVVWIETIDGRKLRTHLSNNDFEKIKSHKHKIKEEGEK